MAILTRHRLLRTLGALPGGSAAALFACMPRRAAHRKEKA